MDDEHYLTISVCCFACIGLFRTSRAEILSSWYGSINAHRT